MFFFGRKLLSWLSQDQDSLTSHNIFSVLCERVTMCVPALRIVAFKKFAFPNTSAETKPELLKLTELFAKVVFGALQLKPLF